VDSKDDGTKRLGKNEWLEVVSFKYCCKNCVGEVKGNKKEFQTEKAAVH